MLKATLVFPFKRGRELNRSFKIQAAARIFLMHKDGSGSNLENPGMMRASNMPITDESFRPSKTLWNGGASGKFFDNGITLVSAVEELSKFPSSSIQEEEDTVFEADIEFRQKPAPSDFAQYPLYVLKKYYTRQQKSAEDGGGYTDWVEDESRRSIVYGGAGRLKPYGTDWNVMYANESEFSVSDAGGAPNDEFVPSIAVWVRVLDQSGKYTLDMAPATVTDDDLNDVNNVGISAIMQDMCGQGIPIIRFTGEGSTPSISYNPKNASTYSSPTPVKWWPQGMYAVDPRYNFAPEDWVSASSSINKDDWLEKIAQVDGSEGRQNDIFFFVSNQGYLQSMAELAFLPRLGNLANSSLKPFGANGGGYNGAMRTDRNNTANHGLMWKTYHAFAENGEVSDDLFGLGIEDGNDTAFRVNPYTPDSNIRLAAFANTPYDWWVAGTNTTSGAEGQNQKSPSVKKQIEDNLAKRLEYAFNESSQEAKMKYDDIANIANYVCKRFSDEVRENPLKSWQEVYDDLPWDNVSEDGLFGIKFEGSDPLHDVDRKFLYGFWRNCFANQQQLFLIFVRAESTALGGAGDGGTPAQLGGRAVALVWRDPNPPLGDHQLDRTQNRADSGYERRPHKTRVLFYHQFE